VSAARWAAVQLSRSSVADAPKLTLSDTVVPGACPA